MVEMPVDPLEPPKFKHERVPKTSGSPPVPVMHSPPRPEVQINDNFAKLSEALYVAKQKAREAVAMRSKVPKEMMMKEKERKEQELRALAPKARSERTGTVAPSAAVPMSSDGNAMDTDVRGGDYEPVRKRERDMPKESKEEREERLQRQKILEERRRERREREEVGGQRYRHGRGGEVMYDQRLFNQEKGMDSGFATDDQYNIYDKGLFTAQPTLSTLYRPKKDMDSDMYGGADEQLDRIMKTERFKPDKGFSGTSEKSGPRDRPVEFEKEAEEADPFGLDQFLTEVKKGKKAMDKVGAGGTMTASAGSSTDGYEGGSNRSRIGFERGH
ncbi:hypothetical protein PTKIN_Ptkin09bG0064100 [Pterospermum kingtungense]